MNPDDMDPHYSDDGRYFWTGTQWLPVRPTSLDQATGLLRLIRRVGLWWILAWLSLVMVVMFWRWLLVIGAASLVVALLALAFSRGMGKSPSGD